MSSLQPPLVGPREPDRSPADFDGLIHGFFRAQMPDPWPVLRAPATPAVPSEGARLRRRSLFRSRVALAASLLILLAGQFCVSGMFPGYTRFATVGERGKTEATYRKLRSPKPAASSKKAEASYPPHGQGILISERR